MDVIGVGALNVDLSYKMPGLNIAGRRFEPGGQVFVDEAAFTDVHRELERGGELVGRSGGGSAANTVAALSRLGYGTGFLGVIGKDDPGKFLLRSMEGTDVSRVKKFQRSGMCLSILSGEERSLLVLPNANEYFSFTEDDVGYLNSSRFVHLGSFAGDNPLNAQKRLVDLLDDQVYVSFAPGEGYARRGLEQIKELMARTRILFVNDREAELLTGLPPREGSRALLDAGPKVVACTLGERGSLIVTKNSELEVPAKRTVVVDRTGAGDVYAAGFLAGYLDGATLEVCGEIASAAAALSMASHGRSGYPDERFLRRYASELA